MNEKPSERKKSFFFFLPTKLKKNVDVNREFQQSKTSLLLYSLYAHKTCEGQILNEINN